MLRKICKYVLIVLFGFAAAGVVIGLSFAAAQVFIINLQGAMNAYYAGDFATFGLFLVIYSFILLIVICGVICIFSDYLGIPEADKRK